MVNALCMGTGMSQGARAAARSRTLYTMPLRLVASVTDDNVVGAGATVLGAVTIGSHSVIGANAVVVADAPAHSVLVGSPAVAKPRCAESTERYSDPAIYVI